MQKSFIEQELHNLALDEQLEKQLDLPKTMKSLNSDHFPLFVTVKRLLYMLDASTPQPFFSRDAEGQLVGMSSRAEWHNEQGGVFMIN